MLLNALSLDKVGVVGPKIPNRDGSFQLSSRRHFPTLGVLISYIFKFNIIFPKNKFFGRYNYTYSDSNLILDVDTTSGACMLFRRELYNKLNGFDERFFLYFEDTDFCIRSNLINYKVIYNPSSSYIHKKRGSVNKKNKYFVNFHFYLSMIKFLFKYYYEYKIFFVSLILLIIIFKTI